MTVYFKSARDFTRSAELHRSAHITILLGTTILMSWPTLAWAECTVDTITQTCTGDQSAGITASTPIQTLIVEDLTTDITPAAGTAGIVYETDTNATVLSDTTEFGIVTEDADGIRVGTIGGDAYIRHDGTVSATGGRGIFVFADNGAAVIEGSGNIISSLDAILANPRLGGAALNWSGNITSTEGQGVALRADNGAASASGSGAIVAEQDAVTIDSRGNGGNSSFKWTGDITSISGTAVTVEAADGGAAVEGSGAISAGVSGFTIDARGASGNASLTWDGTVTAGAGHGILVYSANGGADAKGSNAVSAFDFGILVKSDSNNRAASLVWDGDISSTTSFGARVETADGGATLRGTGTVNAALDGLSAAATGGNAQLLWNGDVTATNGYGLVATSNSGGATIMGSGTVVAGLDAIIATNDSASTATVGWTGDVSSTNGSGILVSSASGASNVSGSGDIDAAIDGISVSNTGTQTAAVTWNGDVTGNSGDGLSIYSAGGAVSAIGSGAVTGGADAFHIETAGNATAALDWVGDIVSTGSNGIHITSALGAVATNTQGALASAGGGIYAWSGSDNTTNSVTVAHQGSLLAAGVGVEARSPRAAVDVTVDGNMQTSSFGIFAESRGTATVSVAQTGSINAGDDAIFAYSSNGAVSVIQAGDVTAFGAGITAENEGAGTVFVGKTGDIDAVGDGIDASSALGDVTVRMIEGNIRAGGSGIVAGNTGNATVAVEMTGNVSAMGDGVMASSANGEVYATVIGDVVAGGTGVSALNVGDGEVGVTQSGDVVSGGDGLVARSASGNATATLTSGTVTSGENGILLGGFGNLSANIAEGAVVTGGTGAAGILFDGGLVNTVTNRGTINNAGGFDDYAILSEANDTLVENFGTISGNVLLGPWANSFNNYVDALFETGSVLNVGVGNTVTNAGIISPGGLGTVNTTQLTGNLVTTETSTLAIDIDMAGGTSDQIAVSGTAALEGDLVLSYNTISATPSSYDLITAGGGVTAQSLSLSDNVFLIETLETILDGNAVRLNLSGLDLSPEGLSSTGSEIGDYFNRAFAAGGAGVGEFGALIVNDGTIAGGETIYNALRPTIWLSSMTSSYLQSQSFANGLMGCPLPSGLHAPLREGDCAWTRLEYSSINRKSTDSGTARTSAYMLTQGMQRAVGNGDWQIGGALGFSFSDTSIGMSDSADRDRLHAGVSVKYTPGPFQFVTALTGSWGEVSSIRRVDLGGDAQSLTGATDVSTYNLKLRGAYRMGSDSFYLMPQVDLNTSYVTSKPFSETGGSAALSIGGMSETIVSLAPAVELGTHRRFEDGSVFRAFGRVGASVSSKGGVGLTSALASDTTGVDGFTLRSGYDTKLFNVALGFTAYQSSGWSVEGGINATLGDGTMDRQASIKFRKSF